MVITSLLRWWYVDGWLEQFTRIKWLFIKVADRFSIGLLFKTLFAPFRQISADETAKTDGGVINVVIDKLISRMIGGVMRLTMIIVGTITLAILLVVSVIRLVIWPIMPFMPLIGLMLIAIVGAPWKII